jgi:hypothetical protein
MIEWKRKVEANKRKKDEKKKSQAPDPQEKDTGHNLIADDIIDLQKNNIIWPNNPTPRYEVGNEVTEEEKEIVEKIMMYQNLNRRITVNVVEVQQHKENKTSSEDDEIDEEPFTEEDQEAINEWVDELVDKDKAWDKMLMEKKMMKKNQIK